MTDRRTHQRTTRGEVARRAATSRRRPSTGHAPARSAATSRRARTLVDHDEIRRWAEARRARPAAVKGTSRRKRDVGMLRLDFPGYSGEGKLVPIDWDAWFDKFDASNLALIVQDRTPGGELSNFNKLVAREGGPRRAPARAGSRAPARPRSRGARAR
jgi:hypothetical protein